MVCARRQYNKNNNTFNFASYSSINGISVTFVLKADLKKLNALFTHRDLGDDNTYKIIIYLVSNFALI